MSRSNPTDNMPHPCARWIEWDGSNGEFRYYDKSKKENVSLGNAMTFILLDQLATIKGWHDASESGIFSNEIRDITQDALVVKSFKGGTLAEGNYKAIRDRIIAHGGHFTANLYVAIKIDDALALGSIQFKGAALSAWMEFSKAHRADLYKKAVRCKGFNEGKKGKIVFRTPIFGIAELGEESDAKANELDKTLQEFLTSYFGRTRVQQVARPPADAPLDDAPNTRNPFDDMPDDLPWQDDVTDSIPF
ncbi:MAG: hypothetical protein NUV75_02075 [Gallionella sp.]|nr:hypothetical protein [Gallionella sp.]